MSRPEKAIYVRQLDCLAVIREVTETLVARSMQIVQTCPAAIYTDRSHFRTVLEEELRAMGSVYAERLTENWDKMWSDKMAGRFNDMSSLVN